MAHLCTQGCWVNHIWAWSIEVNNQWSGLFCTWQALVHNVHLYVIYLLVWCCSCMCRKTVFAFRQKLIYLDMWLWWVLDRMMFSMLIVMHFIFIYCSLPIELEGMYQWMNYVFVCLSLCPFIHTSNTLWRLMSLSICVKWAYFLCKKLFILVLLELCRFKKYRIYNRDICFTETNRMASQWQLIELQGLWFVNQMARFSLVCYW